ncbi:MAG TPA: zinc ribbon domain-containing protein [Solirubrobacteraceae bacterium]|nr:zinc ribbon domain-containing protein [Solirubrobacteraceae bacterium]
MTIAPAIFGITNDTLNMVAQLVLLGFVVVWLALVWYTFADARRRVDDGMLIACATLAAIIFPYLGTIVYMIVRPPEYLEDVRERELEMQAAEARLLSADYQLCPHCDAPAGRDFLRCPHCMRKLRDTCGSCARPLDPDWLLCPYCEAEIPGVTPERRRRRRDAGDEEAGFDDHPVELDGPVADDRTLVAREGQQHDEAPWHEAPPSTPH